ncbi:MAG: hypothetical protein WC969_14445 [Elusimicrobiota bacterium]
MRSALILLAMMSIAYCPAHAKKKPSKPKAPARLSGKLVPLRGHLLVARKESTFMPCDDKRRYPLADRSEGDLRAALDAIEAVPGRSVYAEFLGRLDSRKRRAELLELRRIYREGPACGEKKAAFRLKAMGNEPFWSVEVSDAGILYAPMSGPELRFPAAPAVEKDGTTSYSATAVSPSIHRLSLELRKGRCQDTMSGAYFHMSATLRLDDRESSGCAYAPLRAAPAHAEP